MSASCSTEHIRIQRSIFPLLIVLVCLSAAAIAQKIPPSKPFQRSTAAFTSRNGGTTETASTSFCRTRKEVIFRLYFVDTPEEERVYADRIAEQAAILESVLTQALEVGKEAKRVHKAGARKTVHDLHTLAACTRSQRDLAILRNRCHGRRSRPERATCEHGTGANLRDANTVAGWSRFADIPGAPARVGERSEGSEAGCMGQSAPMRLPSYHFVIAVWRAQRQNPAHELPRNENCNSSHAVCYGSRTCRRLQNGLAKRIQKRDGHAR